KFAQVPQVVSELNGFGFQGKLMLIATGEALSALLLLVPPTRSIGVLLVSGLLGGAIATHMQHGQSYVGPAGIRLTVLHVGGDGAAQQPRDEEHPDRSSWRDQKQQRAQRLPGRD